MLLIPLMRRIAANMRHLSKASRSHFPATELYVIKRFSQRELDEFSALTGDFNSIHSAAVSEGNRKVHGAFLNAIVAAIIGTKFPGNGVVLTKQRFMFPKPCRIDTDTEICLRLIEERKITKVAYECKQMGQIVFKGEADLLLKSS